MQINNFHLTKDLCLFTTILCVLKLIDRLVIFQLQKDDFYKYHIFQKITNIKLNSIIIYFTEVAEYFDKKIVFQSTLFESKSS